MANRGRGRAKNTTVSCEYAEFFKVFQPDLHSHQLMIPPDYMTYFSRTIPERVILKDTDRKLWHVSVEKTRNGVFLRSGWQRFVENHTLSVGEFLVFRYDKSYSFLVKIYGINGCKKGNSAANDDTTTRVKVEEITKEEMYAKQTFGKRVCPREGETSVSLDRPECPFFVSTLTYPKQYNVALPRDLLKRHNVHIEQEMVLRDAKGKEWQVRMTASNDGRIYIGKGWSQFRLDNSLGLKDSCKYTFGAEKSSRIIRVQILRNGSHKKEHSAANDHITTHVKVEESTEDEMINPKQTLGKCACPHAKETNVSDRSECRPFFVSPPSHRKQYHLKMPRGFFERHNLHVESEMVLRNAKGKEWRVRITTCKDGRGYIGQGWTQFRVDNNLGPKDSCKFTFGAEKSSRVIHVQILRHRVA